MPPTGTTPEDTEFAQNNDVAKADEPLAVIEYILLYLRVLVSVVQRLVIPVLACKGQAR